MFLQYVLCLNINKITSVLKDSIVPVIDIGHKFG